MAVQLSEVPFGHDGALLAVLEEANDPAVGGPSALDVRLRSGSVQQLASAPRQVFCYDDLGALESGYLYLTVFQVTTHIYRISSLVTMRFHWPPT